MSGTSTAGAGQASVGRRRVVFVSVAMWMGACFFVSMMFVEDDPDITLLAIVAAAVGWTNAWWFMRRRTRRLLNQNAGARP